MIWYLIFSALFSLVVVGTLIVLNGGAKWYAPPILFLVVFFGWPILALMVLYNWANT
jgi:hypothetical protein